MRELAYTGRRLPADKAKEIGLVNEVFATQDGHARRTSWRSPRDRLKEPARRLGLKAMINYARDHSIADGLDYIGVWNAAMLSGAHMKEAFTAKAEKREANFPDLMQLKDDPL